jgi:replicative DNA helicase
MGPRSHADERVVVAGALRAPDLNRDVLAAFDPAAFAWVGHRWLYESAVRLWKARRKVPCDLPAVWDDLKRRGQLADLGPGVRAWGAVFVEVYESDPTGAWCRGAAGRVTDLYRRRVYLARLRKLTSDAADGRMPADHLKAAIAELARTA